MDWACLLRRTGLHPTPMDKQSVTCIHCTEPNQDSNMYVFVVYVPQIGNCIKKGWGTTHVSKKDEYICKQTYQRDTLAVRHMCRIWGTDSKVIRVLYWGVLDTIHMSKKNVYKCKETHQRKIYLLFDLSNRDLLAVRHIYLCVVREVLT